MASATMTTRLLETDHIDWTVAKLNQRIGETRELIRRLDLQTIEDRDFIWIREQLVHDLKVKESLLGSFASKCGE